jgi:hypothetical protein
LPFFEDFVAVALQGEGLRFDEQVVLHDSEDHLILCDFAIPNQYAPKALILAKPFAAVEDCMDSFLDTVAKLGKSKAKRRPDFFVVTDGMGRKSRTDDLQRLIELQNAGTVDMIFTLRQLDLLIEFVHDACDRD